MSRLLPPQGPCLLSSRLPGRSNTSCLKDELWRQGPRPQLSVSEAFVLPCPWNEAGKDSSAGWPRLRLSLLWYAVGHVSHSPELYHLTILKGALQLLNVMVGFFKNRHRIFKKKNQAESE